MKKLILIIALCLGFNQGFALEGESIVVNPDEIWSEYPLWIEISDCPRYELISKEWVVEEVKKEGNKDHDHKWVYSEKTSFNRGIPCLVDHNGGHCSWNNLHREKICSGCGRLIPEVEAWNEKFIPCPEKEKTEFEILKEKFEVKESTE